MKGLAPLSCTALLAVSALTSPGLAPGADDPRAEEGSVVTLYANDDLRSSFDFRSGDFGARIVEGEVALAGAQIVFDVLQADRLSFGFVHDESVRILDLGEVFVPPFQRAQDPAVKFPVSLYHTLFFDGARFAYRGAGNRVVHYRPANAILASRTLRGIGHVEPQVRHTYLFRFQAGKRRGSDEVVKFEVIDFLPGSSVTLRWARVATL